MRWRDCIERDVIKVELEDVDWRIVFQVEDSGGGLFTGRHRREATLTPEIRETRKREIIYSNCLPSPLFSSIYLMMLNGLCFTTTHF